MLFYLFSGRQTSQCCDNVVLVKIPGYRITITHLMTLGVFKNRGNLKKWVFIEAQIWYSGQLQ